MKLNSAIIRTIALGAAATVLPALAQNSVRVKVDIPFAFQAGQQQFEAGSYVLGAEMGSAVLTLTNRETRRRAMILTLNGQRTEKGNPEATFHVYGNKYYLSTIWSPETGCIRELPTSPAEREWAASKQPYKVAVLRIIVH